MKAMSRTSFILIGFLIVGFASETDSIVRVLKKVGRELERTVKHVVKPIQHVAKHVIERPLKQMAKTLGLRSARVKKRYEHFVQETKHSRVVFTKDSYTVEKVQPCPDKKHDIVNTEQPVTIHFDGGITVIQDRFCRKCGMHFYGEPKQDL